MSHTEGFEKAVAVTELREKGIVQIRGRDRPIALFWHDGRPFAVDDRCPHMGFPLHTGTVADGILTCHWHHARFDLRSGCTFDLFADDVPAYDVRIAGDDVLVATAPREAANADYFSRRLQRGLEQNIGLIQAKAIVGLVQTGTPPLDLIGQIAHFGGRNHDNWQDGMTSLALMARLLPHLSDESALYGLALASKRVARNCNNQPLRRERHPLSVESPDPEQLQRWFSHWILVRHRDGAERTLLTAAKLPEAESHLAKIVFGTLHDRIYSNNGHTVDFANKAFELLDAVGWDSAESLLPTLVRGMASARGERERSAWRAPVDLIPLIEEAEKQIPDLLPESCDEDPPDDLRKKLLGDDPAATLDSLTDSINRGVPPLLLAREICYCAGLRLARFPESNEIDDWFGPVHTFTYGNAVYQSIARCPCRPTVRGVLHAAMSVYVDRFLNIPAARLPGEKELRTDAPGNPKDILGAIAEALNQSNNLKRVAGLVSHYFRLKHLEKPLIDALAMIVFREDLDFHHLQVLEAAVQQSNLWDGGPEAEHLFVGFARYLAAHCPTRRADSRVTQIALRLHRGEPIYESDEAPE